MPEDPIFWAIGKSLIMSVSRIACALAVIVLVSARPAHADLLMGDAGLVAGDCRWQKSGRRFFPLPIE
jgi:hypothetical protein